MLKTKELNVEYITDEAGAKKAVILPMQTFRQLLADIEDLTVAAERRNEDTISHDTLIADLQRDGILQN